MRGGGRDGCGQSVSAHLCAAEEDFGGLEVYGVCADWGRYSVFPRLLALLVQITAEVQILTQKAASSSNGGCNKTGAAVPAAPLLSLLALLVPMHKY
jgi:hypothetical protein